MEKTFLSAEWRKLAMANYAVDPDLLRPYLPAKTEIDTWNHTCYVSLVGFRFLNTRLKGLKIPFHVHFEEVNLRFYVRHRAPDGWRRGVVFIKEIVPKPALTWVANLVYGENYETMPMRHQWAQTADELRVTYQWKKARRWNRLLVSTRPQATQIGAGSEAEFITEHYWGYTRLTENRTSEYGVQHPRWGVYETIGYDLEVDFGAVYGPAFGFLTHTTPRSVFLAEGSEIVVKSRRRV
ncbi:MAG: DUF2071 domain-containing protein [Bernardetiaceae bacterium]|jgi:hypothetical protein|nr:DUF2071 domain-containing protein [Bernardetiaceae bacterium]